ncbi:MAG: ABC transporter permease [Verrucomicrobia bacterium]|nr:ABC transporter permease [Prolixibacteraceae bacterium]
MFKNYLKLAVRNLFSQKGNFILNLFGLITGITAFILIVCWIQSEMSFDTFHQDKENIYRVDFKLFEEEKLELYSAAAIPAIGPELKRHFPEVKEYTRFNRVEGVITYGDVHFKETDMFYAEPSFFSIFTFPLLKGDADTSLLAVNTAVLSQSAAVRYFGNADPIGKVITLNNKDKYYVRGITKDAPSNSHIKFQILLSYQNLINQNKLFNSGWFGAYFYTYVRLAPGTDVKLLENKIPQLPEKFIGDFMKQAYFRIEFSLRKLGDIHLTSTLNNELSVNGSLRSITFLGIIALMVLLIAYVNYINMTTSQAMERAAEVGVRKILGAMKQQLAGQFVTEAVLLNGIAIIISVLAAFFLAPVFHQLFGSLIHLKLITVASLSVILMVIAVMLTGLLPAYYLSSFDITSVIKGKGQTGSYKMAIFKNAMVVFQFAVSVILISGTILINRQLRFVQQQDLGINLDQVLIVEGPQAINVQTYTNQLQAFKSVLLEQSEVKNVTVSSCIPGREITWNPVYGKLVSGTNTEKKIEMIGIDQDFIQTYGLKLVAGRNFEVPFQKTINQLILNESAVRYLGFSDASDAIGKELTGDQGNAHIIGVVHDFNQRSLKQLPQPIAFSNAPWNQYFSVKVNNGKLDRLIPYLEKAWNQQFPGNPLRYFFLRDYFNNQYQEDRQFAQFFQLFSLLAIFIACIGLLSLSAYTITRRTKEIGVRRVNGAKIGEILVLLNKDFVRWVFLAFIIATPLAWFTMHLWLESFAYKTDLSWWIFALAGLLALGIALLTVSWQSWKAAARNPVEALRYE